MNHKVTQLNAAVSPEILVGQIWLQDEPTGVEIIELNTSDENDPAPVENKNERMDHAWSYSKTETLQHLEDNYKINQKARERRRMQQDHRFFNTSTATNTREEYTNNNYYDSDIDNQYNEDNHLINHQVNCFTIINKHFIQSDSSSDAELEIVTSNDMLMEGNQWDSGNLPYKEEIITYDPDLDKEARTIWIYSFKNKHLLAEDDYECGKTAVRDISTSTSCSTENEEEEKTQEKSVNVSRLGSPIPPAYIPRLNLSFGPTLSTVTEVSEPNKQVSPNPSYKSPKSVLQKPINGWFKNETNKVDSARSEKFEKSTNVINWMALSPREKRRRSKETGDKWVGNILKLETFRNEERLANKAQELTTINSIQQDKSHQENSFKLQVDVDVHVSVDDKTPDRRSLGTPNGGEIVLKSKVDDRSPINLLRRLQIEASNTLDRGDHDMKLVQTEVDPDIKLEEPERVDYDIQFGQTQQVMCVTPREPHPLYLRVHGPIDAPEENLKVDPDVWDREESEEKQTASYDYLTDKMKCAVKDPDDVWMKNNTPFLQPSEWNDYASLADSPLTIQMSINETEIKRKTWFKRAFKRIINCCPIKSEK